MWNVLQKLAQLTGVMGRIRCLLPKRIKLLLYHSLFNCMGHEIANKVDKIYMLQKNVLGIYLTLILSHPLDPYFVAQE